MDSDAEGNDSVHRTSFFGKPNAEGICFADVRSGGETGGQGAFRGTATPLLVALSNKKGNEPQSHKGEHKKHKKRFFCAFCVPSLISLAKPCLAQSLDPANDRVPR